jgi:hypothetical protein
VVALLEGGEALALAANDMSEVARLQVADEATGATVSADNAVIALSEAKGAALYDGASGELLGKVAGGADAQLGPGRRLLATLENGRVLLWGAN